MSKKIQDNESIQPLIQLLKLGEKSFATLDKIPFIYKLSPQIKSFKEQFIKIKNDSVILTLPDQFNELFSKYGWVCYGALSQTTLNESVQLALNNKLEEAKLLLINSIDESSIDLILRKCQVREHFKLRSELFELLKLDYLEERYHACIPLLLALIDGLANDISAHVGFFAGKSDLELFDSITAHETGLPFLKIIMNGARKNTTTDKIEIPYRNGILHGRDLNFANKEVASKCWWALACLIEWADEKSLNKEPKKETSFIDTLKASNELYKYRNRINKWESRPNRTESFWKSQTLETLDKTSPEYCLLTFFENWKNKRWGLMNDMLVHTINNERATIKRLKEDYLPIQIHNFSIITSIDRTPAISDITIELSYTKNQENFHQVYVVQINSLDHEGNLHLRGENNSKWYILQLSFASLLFQQ